MNEARESLGRIDEWLARLREVVGSARRADRTPRRGVPTSKFEEALDDDLNISAALGFCLNRFAKPIARWIKMKWTQRPRMRGWIGGNELTLFSISKLSSKSSFRQKSCSSPRSVRTQGAKKNGNAATNYATRFPCLAGKCATPRTERR